MFLLNKLFQPVNAQQLVKIFSLNGYLYVSPYHYSASPIKVDNWEIPQATKKKTIDKNVLSLKNLNPHI